MMSGPPQPPAKSAADTKAEMKAAYWDLLREQKVPHVLASAQCGATI